MAYARKEAIEEGLAEGRAIGIAEGRAEGILAANIETALKLRKLGVAVETISEATGLSIGEIEQL